MFKRDSVCAYDFDVVASQYRKVDGDMLVLDWLAFDSTTSCYQDPVAQENIKARYFTNSWVLPSLEPLLPATGASSLSRLSGNGTSRFEVNLTTVMLKLVVLPPLRAGYIRFDEPPINANYLDHGRAKLSTPLLEKTMLNHTLR